MIRQVTSFTTEFAAGCSPGSGEPAPPATTRRSAVKIRIPHPDTGMGALVATADGEELRCRYLSVTVDVETMQPVVSMELIDVDAEVIGVWAGELVEERPIR